MMSKLSEAIDPAMRPNHARPRPPTSGFVLSWRNAITDTTTATGPGKSSSGPLAEGRPGVVDGDRRTSAGHAHPGSLGERPVRH